LLLSGFQRVYEGFAETLQFPARESAGGNGARQGIWIRRSPEAELLRHHPGCHRGAGSHQVGARSQFLQGTLPWRPQTGEGLAMNIYLDVQSPAVQEAGKLASAYGLANHGLVNLRRVYWNLPTPALYEESIFRSEGRVSHLGPLVVETGKHTARAATDKFVVQEQSSENFSALLSLLQGYLQGRDVFVQDCFAAADPEYSLPIRIITQKAWHSLFARTMFLKI